MITKFSFLIFSIIFSNFINAATVDIADLEVGSQSQSMRERTSFANSDDSAAIAHRTRINAQRVSEAHEILSEDYIDNLKDLRKTRWWFRKTANYTEAFSNVLLYLGTGLSTVSSVMCLADAESYANITLFSGTACVVGHVAFLGIARFSAREEREREHLLKNLARKVGFDIVSLPNTISEGTENEACLRA